MRALVWLRSDLRVRDNPALYEAARRADEGVVALYVPEERGRAPIQQNLVQRELGLLREELGKLNIPLLLRKSVDGVAREHHCDRLFYNWDLEKRESHLESEVFTDQLAVDLDELRNKSGQPFQVFTPFSKAWRQKVEPGVLGLPRKQPEMVTESDPAPEVQEVEGAEYWPAGVAEEWLQKWVRGGLQDYEKLRDYPGLDATSRLSPYLAIGALSLRQCLQAALEHVPLSSGWVTELIWREFYRYVWHHFPDTSDSIPWRHNRSDFERWGEGRTGVPIVDAAMMQLHTEGWMHNRLRMIVAMYLTKDLLIDWRWGEQFFMRHLADGDPANNVGGWCWSASVGFDAAPYFRIYNPYTQGAKFDGDGSFVRKYLPELASVDLKVLHDPTKWPAGLHDYLGYPEPMVDHAEAREKALELFKG